MKKWAILILFAVGLGGGAYYFLGMSRAQPLAEKSLTFSEVRQANIRDIVSATGMVEPSETLVVASESPGTVVRLTARIGDLVSEGAELARLDDRRIELKIEDAKNGIKLGEAVLAQAQAELERALASEKAAHSYLKIQEEQQKAMIGLRTEYETAKAQALAASAGVKLAQAGIEVAQAKQFLMQTALKDAELAQELTRIRVPGYSLNPSKRQFLILDRRVHEGQMVGPQAGPLFMLAGSLDVVEVHAQVTEGDINRIHVKMEAEFIITGFNDEDVKFPGRVKQIRPQASAMPQVGNTKGAVYYDTVVHVHNRKDPLTGEWQLRPGMTASVDIIRREHKNVWKVPVSALNFKLENAYQSEAVRAHLAAWTKRPDAKDWWPLWTWDATAGEAKPVFVRINGVSKNGEPGLKDTEGNEILEWEPGREPTLPLRIIIGAPPARAPGFFDTDQKLKI